MKKVTKAIIPAAGYGTRNLPITKVIPKEMFPINGKPAIHYIVEEAVEAGIEDILIVVSRNKNMILDYFDRSLELEAYLEKANKHHLIEEVPISNISIQYVRQPYAEGLGNAINLGRKFVENDSFAVLLPDDIYLCKQKNALSQLIDAYDVVQSSQIGLQKVSSKFLKNYGVIKERELNKGRYEIIDIIEKPKNNPPSNLAVTGRYVFTPTIFPFLENLEKGSGGELQLTDAIKSLIVQEKCYGITIDGERFDIASEDEYLKLLMKLWKKT